MNNEIKALRQYSKVRSHIGWDNDFSSGTDGRRFYKRLGRRSLRRLNKAMNKVPESVPNPVPESVPENDVKGCTPQEPCGSCEYCCYGQA